MTPASALSLIALLALGTYSIAAPFKATLIARDRAPNGALLAEPIYTPSILLEPTNVVGRAIGKDEVLNCKVGQETYPAQVQGQKSTIHVITLDCDGAKFRVTGIEFERSEP